MIYLAGPLFNDRERGFNLSLCEQIERHVPVFLPQRDGALLVDMIRAGVPVPVAERRVFLQDCQAMREATAIVAVLDGGYVDEGVAFELGFMAALGKQCVALQTDVRRALPSGNNPMILGPLELILNNEQDLLCWIEKNAFRLKGDANSLASAN